MGLLAAFAPSITAILFGSGILVAILGALRHQDARIDELAWQGVEDAALLVEAEKIPMSVLMARIKWTRDFMRNKPSADIADSLLAKALDLG